MRVAMQGFSSTYDCEVCDPPFQLVVDNNSVTVTGPCNCIENLGLLYLYMIYSLKLTLQPECPHCNFHSAHFQHIISFDLVVFPNQHIFS